MHPDAGRPPGLRTARVTSIVSRVSIRQAPRCGRTVALTPVLSDGEPGGPLGSASASTRDLLSRRLVTEDSYFPARPTRARIAARVRPAARSCSPSRRAVLGRAKANRVGTGRPRNHYAPKRVRAVERVAMGRYSLHDRDMRADRQRRALERCCRVRGDDRSIMPLPPPTLTFSTLPEANKTAPLSPERALVASAVAFRLDLDFSPPPSGGYAPAAARSRTPPEEASLRQRSRTTTVKPEDPTDTDLRQLRCAPGELAPESR